MIPSCLKCGRHGRCLIVCLSKGQSFCVEELELEFESYPKKEETYNEDKLSEKCS